MKWTLMTNQVKLIRAAGMKFLRHKAEYTLYDSARKERQQKKQQCSARTLYYNHTGEY